MVVLRERECGRHAMSHALVMVALLSGAVRAADAPDAATGAARSVFITPESFVEGDWSTYTVANGTAMPAYAPGKPTAAVHSRSEVVAFLVQQTSPDATFHGAITVSSSNPNACTAMVAGPATRHRVIVAQARRLFVKLNCLAKNATTSVITVRIPVMRKGFPTAPIEFAFKKRCAGNVAMPGFDVTLGAFMDEEVRTSAAYVVHNGETRTAYAVDDPSARITYDTTDLHMYVSTANVSGAEAWLPFLTPIAHSSQPWCRALLSGAAAHGGTAEPMPKPLVFKFDCSGEGITKITVTIPIPGRPTGIQFAFLKECRAGEIPGFDVTLSSYEPGVRASYAVKNGEPTSAYRVPSANEVPLAVVREAQFKTSFYLQMSTFNSLEFEAPIVRSSDSFCLVTTAGDAAAGGWVDDISSTLIINFNCVDSGTALVTVSVPVQVQDRLVNSTFAFRKECRWTSTPGFDVTFGAWIAQESATYAIRNGAATAAYSLWSPKAVVRSSQYTTIFYLQMSTKDTQDFEWPTVESSDSLLKVALRGPAAKGGTAKPVAEKPVALIAKYECMKSGSAVVTITIPLGPWNEAAFSFIKECSVGEIPGFDVTLGAWVPGDRNSYAVKNGAATEAYDATEHAAIIRAGTPSYTFYLMNSGDSALAVDRPSIEVVNPEVTVNMSGDALTPGPLDQQARSLVLDFSCDSRAKTDVIIYLRVSAGNVAFGFRKDCKPLTIFKQAADTPHEVKREAERITSRDGASNRLGNILLGIFLGMSSSVLYSNFFGSPQAKGYRPAKTAD